MTWVPRWMTKQRGKLPSGMRFYYPGYDERHSDSAIEIFDV